MSADNYAICPRCQRRANEKQAAAKREAEAAYGKKPLAEYEAMRKAADGLVAKCDTLAEGFEGGIDGSGHFEVRYSAYCPVCEFSYSYRFGPKPVGE